MRKKFSIVLALVIAASLQGFSQFEGAKQTYSAPNLKEEIGKHKLG